jgi:hypothetical protein
MPKKKSTPIKLHSQGKGSLFEEKVELLFRKIFSEAGYHVIDIRRQQAGSQNGFDIRVTFLDDDSNERVLFFECKNYETLLDWENILEKILELASVSYSVDGFIVLSPKVEVSNINDNIQALLMDQFKFPIKHWTPNSDIETLFSLDSDIYEEIYQKKFSGICDRSKVLASFKAKVDSILKQKRLFEIVNKIEIKASSLPPTEDPIYKTNLDNKLDEVLDPTDPLREEYHQYRCDYKIFLEGLSDLNNPLRIKIQNWQDNLRRKAKRLTKKHNDLTESTPTKFFHDFFDEAEKELLTFYSAEKLDGDKEKLLHGVVFELAAECPLDWRKVTP